MSDIASHIERKMDSKLSLSLGEPECCWTPSSDWFLEHKVSLIIDSIHYFPAGDSFIGHNHWYATYQGRRLGYLTKLAPDKVFDESKPFRVMTVAPVKFIDGNSEMGGNLPHIQNIAFEGTESECKHYLANAFVRASEFYHLFPLAIS